MSVVVNMTKMRKAMDRAKRQAEADANVLNHGRTLSEQRADQARVEAARKLLDGHERERS